MAVTATRPAPPLTGASAVPPSAGRPAASATAARVRLLAGASAVLVAALVAVLTVQVRRAQHGLDVMGHQSAPVVVAASDLYFALNDMDAQLANVLIWAPGRP